MEGFHLFQLDPSKADFSHFLIFLFSQHTPNLGFWPKFDIQMNQYFMKVIGVRTKRSKLFKFPPKERIGSKGAKLGSHSHKVAIKRYNNKFWFIIHKLCLRSFPSLAYINQSN